MLLLTSEGWRMVNLLYKLLNNFLKLFHIFYIICFQLPIQLGNIVTITNCKIKGLFVYIG